MVLRNAPQEHGASSLELCVPFLRRLGSQVHLLVGPARELELGDAPRELAPTLVPGVQALEHVAVETEEEAVFESFELELRRDPADVRVVGADERALEFE